MESSLLFFFSFAFSFEMIVGKFTSIRSSGQNGKTISRTEQLLNNTPLATRGNTSGKRGGGGMGDLYPWVEKSAMKVKYSCPGHIMSLALEPALKPASDLSLF